MDALTHIAGVAFTIGVQWEAHWDVSASHAPNSFVLLSMARLTG
jgi:hypothetical protein